MDTNPDFCDPDILTTVRNTRYDVSVAEHALKDEISIDASENPYEECCNVCRRKIPVKTIYRFRLFPDSILSSVPNKVPDVRDAGKCLGIEINQEMNTELESQ